MKHRPKEQASLPKVGLLPRSLLVATLLLSAPHVRGETSPGEEARWQAKTVFELAARVDYVSAEGHVSRRDAIVGSAHLRFASPTRPTVAGLMVEYRFRDVQADTLLVAGVFAYGTPKWTAAASPFYKRTNDRDAGDWNYWASVRRHFAIRHALGVELFGALDTGRPEKWMLGYIIGLGALLGSTGVWMKLLTEYMTTMQIVSSRIVLASLTMLALLAVRGELRWPSAALLRGAALLGIFDSVVPYTLMAFGARRVEAGLGSVLIATMPLFTNVFAVVLAREERLSITKLGALAVGFVGVMIIAAPKGLGVGNGFQSGLVAFLGASVALGASTVYGRRLLKEARALEVSAWKLVSASVLVVPAMLVMDGTPDVSAFAARPLVALLLVGVISTGLARMAYLWASGVVGSTSVSLVTYVMPGAGLMAARLVLGEQPAPTTIAGLALIFVSLAGVRPTGAREGLASKAREVRRRLQLVWESRMRVV
jgi:drug/metabolite transporter (DMT)-like permease